MLAGWIADVLADEGASSEICFQVFEILLLELRDQTEPALGHHGGEAVADCILGLILWNIFFCPGHQAHIFRGDDPGIDLWHIRNLSVLSVGLEHAHRFHFVPL